MNKLLTFKILYFALLVVSGCAPVTKKAIIQDVTGASPVDTTQIWLTHEHILVDFIGADSINPDGWVDDSVIPAVLPYLEELKEFKVSYFVDATPDCLGRDVRLLEKIANQTGREINICKKKRNFIQGFNFSRFRMV